MTASGKIVVALFTQLLIPLAWVRQFLDPHILMTTSAGDGPTTILARTYIRPCLVVNLTEAHPQLKRGNQKRGALFQPTNKDRGQVSAHRVTIGSGLATK